MSSYLVWLVNQVGGATIGWVAQHPAESTLITAALANPATRKITLDVIKIVTVESIKSWYNISRGVGSSLVTRSTFIARIVTAARTVGAAAGRVVMANPIATGVTLALTGAIAQTSGAYGEDAGIRGTPGSVPPSYHLVGGRPWWEQYSADNLAPEVKPWANLMREKIVHF